MNSGSLQLVPASLASIDGPEVAKVNVNQNR